jgi:ligand-binding sensor domain-containing protein
MKVKNLLISMLFLPFLMSAQRSLNLITSENSKLPDNEVWSIAVDKSGTKWFGTANGGLVKYNGSTFRNFTPDNSIIKGNHIGPLFVDLKGKLWIGATNPDGLFTIVNDSLIEIKNKIVKELGGVITIAQNNNGILYFGGKNGLIKCEGNRWSKIDLPVKQIVPRTISISSNNTIAIGHNSGLLIGTEKKWEIFEEGKGNLQLSVVRGLKFISNDKLIIGYGGGMGNGGFSIKDGTKWVNYNKSNSNVPDNTIRDVEADDNGNYWMASNNGLIKLSPDGKIEPVFFRKGAYQNTILDVAIENNVIWVATNLGVIEFRDK